MCRIANEFCKKLKTCSGPSPWYERALGLLLTPFSYGLLQTHKKGPSVLLQCRLALLPPSPLPSWTAPGKKLSKQSQICRPRPPSSFFLCAMILFLWREGGRDRLKWSRNADMGWAGCLAGPAACLALPYKMGNNGTHLAVGSILIKSASFHLP